MRICIFCGKGGVGKTTSAVSLSLHLASKEEKTAIIDYDGGHSVKRTLDITDDLSPNVLHSVAKSLSLAIIENVSYTGIKRAKMSGMNLEKYLAQFPGNQGLVPLADMVNEFFGVPTDIPTIQKFASLVTLLQQFKELKYKHVIIDVEPTAGLERMLSNAHSTARSLINLQEQGIVTLALIGAKWPDIGGYLKGEYIKKANLYSEDLTSTASMLKAANYIIVSTPEASPISQTFDVRKIIDRFGGKIQGYIVNNIRGESHELNNIALLRQQNLPLALIARCP